MKLKNRTALGLISCFLLTLGLARAAQRIDPLTQSIGTQSSHNSVNETSSGGCTSMCIHQGSINETSSGGCTSMCIHQAE